MLQIRHARALPSLFITMRRKKSGPHFPHAISSLIRSVYPAPAQFDAVKVFAWWAKSVPSRIVRNARPVFLKNGLLTVHVTSSVWAQELHYMRQDLLKRIQSAAPKGKIKDIRFKVGKLPDLPASSAPTGRERVEPIAIQSLPPELGRALGRVRNDELRDVIARAATTAVAFEKS